MSVILGRTSQPAGRLLGTIATETRGQNETRIDAVLAALFKRTLYATYNPREFRCRCVMPQHAPDTKPSLRVDVFKQVVYCDVCAWGTGIVGLVRLGLECSSVQARRWLVRHGSTLQLPVPVPLAPRSRAGRCGKTASHQSGGRRVIYRYRSAAGDLLFQKIRTPSKQFFYRRRLPSGEWAWGLAATRRVLYRLPELRERRWVLVVEGEKDVDNAWRHGLAATTNPEGAGRGKWQPTYSAALRKLGVKRVYVIPDNDDVGRLHADEIVRSCRQAGLQAWSVPLPDLPEHGDLSDFFEAGGSRNTIMRLCRRARSRR